MKNNQWEIGDILTPCECFSGFDFHGLIVIIKKHGSVLCDDPWTKYDFFSIKRMAVSNNWNLTEKSWKRLK